MTVQFSKLGKTISACLLAALAARAIPVHGDTPAPGAIIVAADPAQALLDKAYALHDQGGNHETEIFELYRKSAQLGNADAMLDLGFCFQNGQGTTPDIAKAIDLYQQAAAKGQPLALYNLGVCYASGAGVPVDAKKALDFYRKAAEKGCPNAYSALAGISDDAKDPVQAAFNYRKAAELGYIPAMSRIGNDYMEGTGVEKNYDLAFKWFLKSASNKNPEGTALLGWLYENGFGVAKDLDKAMDYYLASAKLGNKWAQDRIANAK